MRWDPLRLTDDNALISADLVTRTFDTPEFRGMTFHEIHAKSIINRVPGASEVPFEWTVNPYRGCSHACTYCFARNTHTYLDFDAGRDFDTNVVVKVNAPALLRRELAAPRWRRAPIAMGTNVDPYQRAEGRYRLMPAIIEALRDHANPFSILTKGTLILRDLDLLADAATRAPVSVALSIGGTDPAAWRAFEPGTPSPAARLGVVRALTARGIGCSILMAPILPYLTDSPAQLQATVAQIAAAGATHITPVVLHLRTGAREWFLSRLARSHPHLLPRYQELYGRGAYAPMNYQRHITDQVAGLAQAHGLVRAAPAPASTAPAAPPRPEQLTIM